MQRTLFDDEHELFRRTVRAFVDKEIAPHHALRVSAISFAGRIAIGLCADGDAIPELPELAKSVERSLVELTEGTPTR